MFYVGEEVEVVSEKQTLSGRLHLPSGSSAIVAVAGQGKLELFAPLASALHEVNIATFLVDLGTGSPSSSDPTDNLPSRSLIEVLSSRLEHAVDWLSERSETRDLDVGFLGLGRSAGASLLCASREPYGVEAVLVTEGFELLTDTELEQIQAATLLVTAADNTPAQMRAERALGALRSTKAVRTISGSVSNLLEEPHAVTEALPLITWWFSEHLLPLRKRAVG
ncbi:MAG: hypothetical protein KDD69_09005 [Bdellovibrionales bacterium]|nr:hypothetical protein [Bdellovibrionales bacterium]